MDDITFKVCIACGTPKPIEEFYKHPKMADGHIGKCKECQKANAKLNYRRHLGARKKYEKTREQTSKRKAQKKKYFLLDCEKHPEKRAARIKAGNALRAGKLERKPCQRCGRKAQMHHIDYFRPLEVEWYCAQCHKIVHGEQNGQQAIHAG